jgi:hypothetical protein
MQESKEEDIELSLVGSKTLLERVVCAKARRPNGTHNPNA